MLKNVNLKRLFAQQTKKGIKPAPETLLKIKAMTPRHLCRQKQKSVSNALSIETVR